MHTQRLLGFGLTVALAACSGDSMTSPTTATPAPTPVGYSVQVLVSQGNVGGVRGIQSPASVDIAFRTSTGQLMDIVSATLVLRDDSGAELTRQGFGPSAGLLPFRPAWSGDAVGRKIDITLEARVSGQIASTQFTLTL